MSLNSSLSSNASLPPSTLSPSFDMYLLMHKCFTSTVGVTSITAFTITIVVFFCPIYVFVLYLGLQRWRQQCPNATMSHCDVLTYHSVGQELLSICGSPLVCCGIYTDLPQMIIAGIFLCIANLSGQMCFHVLTCVERYLAVVQPITYRSLKKANGIRCRNITIGCVWLLCFVGTALILLEDRVPIVIVYCSAIAVVLVIVCFCSLSVLCVLIRPGPGEGGGGRGKRVDPSKLKAFYTIMAILGVLLLRVCGYISMTALYASAQIGESESCGVWLAVVWFSLPSSLVLPLLFLQRAKKLPCCQNSSNSAQGSD